MPNPQRAPGQNSKEGMLKETHGNLDLLETEIRNYLLAESGIPMGGKRTTCMSSRNKGRV